MSQVELLNRMAKMEQALYVMNDRIIQLEAELKKYATHGQLKISESNTKNLINQNSILINNIQKQLTSVVLPSDTRYYLSTNEIDEFRSNYQTLIAMMTDAEKLYRSLISYVTQFKIN